MGAKLAEREARDFVAAHRSAESAELWGIGELCSEFGVTLRALRFYEDKGLLAPRRVNGARAYTRGDRARLALILRAKAIGSPLAEIKRFLDLYGRRGEGRTRQLEFVLRRTGEAIAELEAKRAKIEQTLAELRLIHSGAREELARRAGTA